MTSRPDTSIRLFGITLLTLGLGLPALGTRDYTITLNSISHVESGCDEIGEEEYTAFVKITDNAGLNFTSGCFTRDFNGNITTLYNQVLVVRTNTDATTITFGMDAWEDDAGSRCSFDSGDDDCRLNSSSLLATNFFGTSPGVPITFTVGNGQHAYSVTLVWTYTIPAAPQNVTATLQTGPGVRIAWSPVENANEYLVFRAYLNNFGSASMVGATMGTNYLDTSVSWGNHTSAYYWVVGENFVLDQGPPSAVASVDIRLDYGDAFNGYPVRLTNNGARHAPVGPRLGTRVDAEADAPNNVSPSTATGDDISGGPDDEDGLIFPALVSWGAETAITVLVSQASGRVDIWVDWDKNTAWDSDERIFTGVLASGTHVLPVTPPDGLTSPSNSTHVLRARITSSSSGSQSVSGFGGEGEVEDYVLSVTGNPPGGLTQYFSSGMTNLSFTSITFTPGEDEPSNYTVCRRPVNGYFIDPSGGTALDFTATNDITVGPFREPTLFWTPTVESDPDTLRVGRDGSIRFSFGSEPDEAITLARHFDDLRLSALFTELDGSADRVSWKELSDRVVVTYDAVEQTLVDVFIYTNTTTNFFTNVFNDVETIITVTVLTNTTTTVTTNSFQVEAFFDGRQRVTYLDIGSSAGIVGLSRMDAAPYALGDLTASPSCCGIAPDNSGVTLIPGSALVTAGGSPNTAGDNFDLDRSGGGARMTTQCGFGDIGNLYFNVDTTNLYIGATGVDTEGPNAMLIFLGLSSLTDDQTNLTAKSGGPGALDNLNNLTFGQPMDLALIVGDEFGDGNFTSFSIGGNDFGQGVFYLGAGNGTPIPVTGAKLSQFDGFGTSAVTNQNMDGDQQVNRWEAAIPLNTINATGGIAALGQIRVLGVTVGGNSGGNRYLSGNYLGASATGTLGGDNNYGFTNVTIDPLIINSTGDRYVAPGGGHIFPFLTWAHAATNIQAAIDVATDGETIYVSNGVYQTGGRLVPGLNGTNRVVIDKAVRVESVNGPTVTVIQGLRPRGVNAVRGVYMTNGAELIGFTVRNSASPDEFNDIHGVGGGIYCVSTNALVENCIIENNQSNYGGNGILRGTVRNSLITGNDGGAYGGGTRGSVVYDSRIIGNSVVEQGGGAGFSTTYNCLIVSNTAAGAVNLSAGGGVAGGIHYNATVIYNSSVGRAGGASGGTFYNAIVHGNTAPTSNNHFNTTFTHSLTAPLPGGAFNSGGNITNAPAFVNAAGGDYRLTVQSPGVNVGNNAFAPGATDLDGNPRIAFGTVDMGAYELPSISTNLVVTSTGDGDAGSLRQTIAALPPGGTITFDPALSGQTILLRSQLVIDKDLAIDGSGLAVAPILSGGNSNRVLFITNFSDVRLDTLTIADGAVTNTASPNSGGGIYMQGGQLYVYNCTIRNNVATFGGGVSVIDADTSFRNTTIANNAALSAFPDGGGILLDGSSAMSLRHCTISGNSATDEGGGIKVNAGYLILENTVVAGNGPSAAGSDIRGEVNFSGVNFIGTTNGATLFPGTILTGNALLGPLQDNGGPTWTMVPATNSPLREAAAPSLVDRDQRGAPRPGGLPDIGAVEVVTSTTFYVALDNPTPQWPYLTWATAATTIQDAIDEASPGNTVLVSNGVYQTGGRVVSGSLLTNRVVIDKPITVQSVNGAGATTIRGNGPNGDAAVRCVWMTNGATLVGFTLTNGATRTTGDSETEQSGGGVWAQSSNVVVSTCTLSGNSAHSDGGGAYGGTVNNSHFVGNQAALGGGASFYLNPGTLNNCMLIGNSANSDGGGSLLGTLNNCTLTGNSAGNRGGGSWAGTLNNGIVYFNNAPNGPNYFSGTINFTCTTPLPAGGAGNITNDPLFVSLATTNLQLSVGSPAINRGNNANAPGATDLDGNPRIAFGTVDMGAYEYQGPTAPSGSVHYVSLDNPTPVFPYTNWATAAASIQGAIDAAVPGNTVLVSNGVYQTGGRTIPGSLLTNRVVIDKPITVQSVNGAGATTIRGNSPNGDAAVRCVWMTNGATLVGFTLTNGATRTSGNNATERSGGGVWAQSTNAVVNHCMLTGNSAGLYGGGAYDSTMNNCTLTGNSAPLGGGAYFGTLNNCILTGNNASDGGGASDSTLNNCTLTANSATTTGGGAVDSTLNNSIVYFNNVLAIGPNVHNCNIKYSCTTPLPFGIGNITNAPQFVDAANSNFTLMASSPARDMGNNASAPSGPDLAGNPRIVHGYVDMGAYEFQDSPPGDYDGDGMTTTDERIAGSDPLNTGETWGIEADTAGSLTFNTLSNRLYAVDRNDNLAAVPPIWTEFTNNIPGTGGAIEINDPLPGTNRNYRVRVNLEP